MIQRRSREYWCVTKRYDLVAAIIIILYSTIFKVGVMSFYNSDQRMSEAATAGGVSCGSAGTGLVVMVRELGHGMERGELHLRRPFNGHYIPPQRVVKQECAEENVSAVASKIADHNDEGCVGDSLDDDIMELD